MTKFYLCVDLINPKTNKEEVCYLVEEEIDAILKFTSYCKDKKMLINTINKRFNSYIISNNLKNDFYIKKTKKEKKVTLNVLYENDEDILYTNAEDLFKLIVNNRLIVSSDDSVIKLFELLESLITDSSVKARINKTFYERFDSDKNPEYVGMENFPLWKKIILVKENLKIALDNICKEPFKKVLFNTELKKIINVKLINEDKIKNNKILLEKKLKRKNKDATSIFNSIKNNLDDFYNIKSEVDKDSSIKKADEIITDYVVYEEDYDDFISYYKAILCNCDDDEKDDLMLYLDEMEEEIRKNKNI